MLHRLVTTTALIAAATVLSAPSASATEQDTAFVKSAHQGNLAEIAAGQDAQKHATTACVKNVGGVLVRDHTKLDAGLKLLAGKLDITLPSSPTAEQQKKLAAVQMKAGTAAYDATWLADQDAAHTKTLAMIDQQISAGGNSELVAAVRAARPVVAMHHEMVRGGTCRHGKDAATISAGSGGHLAARETRINTIGTVSLAGGLLTAGAALWLVRRRETGSR
ncbi:DUF4142 domain-containing protein [Streptomyces sp. NPDC003038]|uniref:DUF4142 domain-containing protein n=1 Tax=unclassified Streptomyces TaxID=2593676 RepID=UPI0033BAE2EE